MNAPFDLWTVLPVPVLEVGEDDMIVAANPAAEDFLNLSERSLRTRRIWGVLRCASDLVTAFERARVDELPLTAAHIEIAPPGRGPLRATLHCVPAGAGMIVALAISDPGPGLSGSQTHKAARSAIGMAEMLAHEIKNPLAGITGAAQLLSMSLSKADQELTDLIVGECRRITALLAQVEHFGNQQPAAREPVNLHDVLDRARQSATLGFAAHMTIIEDYDPSLPEAFVDRDQLLQVVLNLVKNAAEANPDGGTIKLRSFYDATLRARDGGKLPLQIEISDDGPGLPSDIADQVFDPFVSGRENGTGLGLALVSKLMRDNGGLVSVESAPGRTVFRLSLPRRLKE